APLLAGLDDDERRRLAALATAFLHRKEIKCVAGDALPPRTLYALAAQAALPVLNLGLDWYRDWHTVVVYPADFVARHEYVDEDGVVHQSERALSGEAWPDGPVILSRDGIEEGLGGEFADNLVIHEMAHKLDMSNGVVNGVPALHVDMPHADWTAALSGAYEDFSRRVAHRQETPFDDYAAEDPGEFFAVASESFFVEPEVLAAWYPDVYAQFRAFYRQDPLARQGGHDADG
ncbi:MAG: zinc-dependent peptidase, partial [Myxococcales bacterium]|nr:zinc-dependent peptidase [Myxococcales bacterium]